MHSEYWLLSQNSLGSQLTTASAIIACVSFCVALIFARFARPLGEAFGVIDRPYTPDAGGSDVRALGQHKRHTAPVPAVGGIIVAVCGLLMVTLNSLLAGPKTATSTYGDVAITSALLVIMLMGLIDDRKHISATRRLIISTLVFGALLAAMPRLILYEVNFYSINLRIEMGWLAVPVTLMCLVAAQNAVNMVDGRNGLLLGLAIGWTAHFMQHAPIHMLPILGGLLATLLVLFIANLKGKLFMGDCGAYGIASFAAITVLNLHTSPAASPLPLGASEVVMMFLVPGLDMLRLIITRMASGRSPFAADNDHLHHLLDDSIGWARGWWVYMALAFGPLIIFNMTMRFPLLIIGIGAIAYMLVVRWARRRIGAQSATVCATPILN
jgi:UDP-GlcNAc:undecaprenyl-phosphate/decaprenyl-phosphate GlcNAc-1-phosphate transferase